jgi:hypothetical protein
VRLHVSLGVEDMERPHRKTQFHYRARFFPEIQMAPPVQFLVLYPLPE